MSKWYKVSNLVYPMSKEIILEEVDGTIYERYVVGDDETLMKISGERKFSIGYEIERLKRLGSNVILEEMTDGELFSLLL